MANKTLVTVVQGGKFIREYRYDALMSPFFERLERAHGVVELRDPNLEEKGFTKDEIEDLRIRFGMMPLAELPSEPEPFDFDFRGEPTKETVESTEPKSELDSMTKKELKEYLKSKDIEFDGRSNTQTLLELAKTI
jgi:hypothetical protein